MPASSPARWSAHEHGLFGMWVPRSLGGAELDPLSSLRDPGARRGRPLHSVGRHGRGAGHGDGRGVSRRRSRRRDVRRGALPVVAGQGTRPARRWATATATCSPGHGASPRASSMRKWIHTLGIVEETGQPLIFVLPVEKAQLIDNWDVLGLRARAASTTSSRTSTCPRASPLRPRRGSTWWPRFTRIMHFALICHQWALGVSRRMLDELAGLVQAKAGRPGTLADSSGRTVRRGRGEVVCGSTFIDDTWRGVGDTIAAEGTLSHEQRTMTRLALYRATWAARRSASPTPMGGGRPCTVRRLAVVLPRHAPAPSTSRPRRGDRELRSGARRAGSRHEWLYMNLVPVAGTDPGGDES